MGNRELRRPAQTAVGFENHCATGSLVHFWELV